MPASGPFTGFYSQALRALLPCLTGQELIVFLALCSYVGPQGTSFPGIRELSATTTLPTTVVSHILKELETKGMIIYLRKDERDPFTGKMIPDVYAVNPEIVLVSDPKAWYENRFRHNASIVHGKTTEDSASHMPESLLSDEITQADRITEAESGNQKQRSRITSPEGAATLQNANAARAAQPRTLGDLISQFAPQHSATAPNSLAQPQNPPPGSGASPSRDLTFPESVAANAIRQHVPDMSANTARKLITRYGVERVTAAVSSYEQRNQKRRIDKPTGWIIRNLESGAPR